MPLLWDAEQMADFFKENFEGKWQVYAERSSEYYRTMILEQQSERGGVRLIKSGETITGMFAYAGEGAPEVREPLFLQGYEEEIVRQIRLLQKDSGKPVRVYAAPPSVRTDFRPVIMARIICLKQFLPALTVPEEMEMACSFAVIDPLVTQNSRIWKLYSGPDEQEIHVCETEDSEGSTACCRTDRPFIWQNADRRDRKKAGCNSDRTSERGAGEDCKVGTCIFQRDCLSTG